MTGRKFCDKLLFYYDKQSVLESFGVDKDSSQQKRWKKNARKLRTRNYQDCGVQLFVRKYIFK